MINTALKLSRGNYFKFNKIWLDEEIMVQRKSKEKTKNDKLDTVVKHSINKYNSYTVAYNVVASGRTNEKEYKTKEFKAVIA